MSPKDLICLEYGETSKLYIYSETPVNLRASDIQTKYIQLLIADSPKAWKCDVSQPLTRAL